MTTATAPSTAPPARRQRRWGPLLLSAPSIVWYTAFFVAPILLIVWYSFGIKDTTKLVPVDMAHPGLGAYRSAFSDTFAKVFKATIRIAVVATALCVAVGMPVAYFIAFKVKERWRGILLTLIIVPSFTSFLIRTLAWRIPLAANGTISKTLQHWGLIGGPIHILDTRSAVQLAIVYNYLGFMILPLFVAFDRIEGPLREASKDLGAGRLKTFLQVTMPLAGPGVAAGILLTFIPMCGDFVTATILGGVKGNMIGSMIESNFVTGQNWPLGSAMAVLMIGAVLACLAVAAIVVVGFSWLFRRLRRVDVGVAA